MTKTIHYRNLSFAPRREGCVKSHFHLFWLPLVLSYFGLNLSVNGLFLTRSSQSTAEVNYCVKFVTTLYKDKSELKQPTLKLFLPKLGLLLTNFSLFLFLIMLISR